MPSLQDFLWIFLDTLTGHIALVAYLLAITDEQAVWKRLKKFPLMLLSPLIATLLSFGLYAVPELRPLQYFIVSFIVLVMSALFAASAGVHLGVSIIVALLLYRLRFGK